MSRILVGVAWPYSNGPQHLGHLAGNLLPADIFARYHRLTGDEVVMVSGSDMHGTPTTVRAEQEGVSPQVIAERYHQVNVAAFRALGLSFDTYTSTHTALHERTAQEVFLTLLQEGYVEKRTSQGAFCPKHRRFLPDRYVTGTCPHCSNPSARGDECPKCSRVLEPQELQGPRCKLCGTTAEFRPTEHFYLLLPKLTEQLQHYHAGVRDRWRPSVRSFTENYVKEGLRPRPITRDISWGVPIPLDGYDEKRLYVWFEAVIGYLSATKEWALRQGDPEQWKLFWDAKEAVRVYQFMGKDNITFHTIIWPAILLGVGGLQLPYDVPANEFLNIGGEKLSKSETDPSTSVFLPDLLARFSPETIRFYAAYHAPQNHDTEFDPKDLSQDHDQILADQWGNLVQRCLTFTRDRYGGKVPSPPPGWSSDQSELGKKIRTAHAECTEHFEKVELKEALDRALELVRQGNQYFHESKPWSLQGTERDLAIYETLWLLRTASVLLAPFLPFSSERISQMLGAPELLGPGAWSRALSPPTPGTTLGEVAPLFPKLLTAKAASKPTAAAMPSRPTSGATSPAGAPALDIRVGSVVEVADHPKADKLYVLKVDLGEGNPRILVAGIKPFYKPEELRGKLVAVLSNLEPRPLRGVTSQGMILAAEAGATVAVLTAPSGTPPGTPLRGIASALPTIRYDDFARARLVVAATKDGRELDVGAGLVAAELPPGAPPLLIAWLDRTTPGSSEALVLATGGCLTPDRPLPPGGKVR
ncbi:MAG: methionine--tRNA ligase [Euryarchaeota archaeon]|nr:methionine--tRNA ligase [Euryarchaeota archaeon]MDE1837773.1 methionine--tRNA ligase [Euryarchaeota archaeon]MDE1880188.1 methionine--tRNA ligase [Euryarchaeota archaeon]MDE2045405.1 methionine--tRNA ligase [Thermoplasmata archaeon]